MKLTKAQIKTFEDEDREMIEQTEADIEAGNFVEVVLTEAERSAIARAAHDAVKRYRAKGKKSSSVTVHVKTKSTAAKTAKTAKPAKTLGAKATRKNTARKPAR